MNRIQRVRRFNQTLTKDSQMITKVIPRRVKIHNRMKKENPNQKKWVRSKNNNQNHTKRNRLIVYNNIKKLPLEEESRKCQIKKNVVQNNHQRKIKRRMQKKAASHQVTLIILRAFKLKQCFRNQNKSKKRTSCYKKKSPSSNRKLLS